MREKKPMDLSLVKEKARPSMLLSRRIAKLTKTSCNNSCSSKSITLQCKRRGLLLLVGLSPGHSHSTTIAFLLPRSLCILFAWLARVYPLDAFALILRLRIVATFLVESCEKLSKSIIVSVRFSLILRSRCCQQKCTLTIRVCNA